MKCSSMVGRGGRDGTGEEINRAFIVSLVHFSLLSSLSSLLSLLPFSSFFFLAGIRISVNARCINCEKSNPVPPLPGAADNTYVLTTGI